MEEERSEKPRLINTQAIQTLSIFNPPAYGDEIQLHGKLYTLKQSSRGWTLYEKGSWVSHPRVKDLAAMTDLIACLVREADTEQAK